MLPVAFEEFELFFIFGCCFSFRYHCHKMSTLAKNWGGWGGCSHPARFLRASGDPVDKFFRQYLK